MIRFITLLGLTVISFGAVIALKAIGNPKHYIKTRKRNNEFRSWRVSTGYKGSYFRDRPRSVLGNQILDEERFHSSIEAAKGILPGTDLSFDLMVITESLLFWSIAETRVMRIITDRTFPRLLVNRYTNDAFVEADNDYAHLHTSLVLEGDFYKHFEVWCGKNKENETLALLTPDVMQALMDLPPKIDVEFSENSIFIYFRTTGSRLEFELSTKALFVAANILTSEVLRTKNSNKTDNTELFKQIESTYFLSTRQKTAQILFILLEVTCFFILTTIFVASPTLMFEPDWNFASIMPVIAICYVLVLAFVIRRIQKQYVFRVRSRS